MRYTVCSKGGAKKTIDKSDMSSKLCAPPPTRMAFSGHQLKKKICMYNIRLRMVLKERNGNTMRKKNKNCVKAETIKYKNRSPTHQLICVVRFDMF